MTPLILTIAYVITPAEALALADSECGDWLTRPCGGTQPDEFARDCDPEWSRSIGEVEFIQHGERQ
jgi:hypothetical protein